MNLESLKSGFLSYLTEKLEEQGKQVPEQALRTSSASIFMYGNEFKEYLVQECNADASIFSKSMNEIMDMDFENGELVDKSDDAAFSSSALSNEQITEFLDSVGDMSNVEFEIPDNELSAFTSGAQNAGAAETQATFSAPETATSETSGETTATPEITQKPAETDGFTDGSDINTEQNTDGNVNDVTAPTEGTPSTEGNTGAGEFTDGKQTSSIDAQLEEFYSNPDVVKALDVDGDGKLSDEEKTKFEEHLTQNGGENAEITGDMLNQALKDIQDGKFSYDDADKTDEVDKPDKTDTTYKTDKTEDKKDNKDTSAAKGSSGTSGSSGASGASGGGGGGGTGGVSGASSDSTTPATIDDSMSLEELEQERTTKQGELSDAQNELSDVYSGEDSEVKSAQDDYDKAEEDYQEAVENDPALEKYKEEIASNLEEIDNAQKDIDTAQNQVNECESAITDQESTISGLESELAGAESALSSYSGSDLSDDQKAKQAEAQAEVDRLKAEIEEAKATLEELEANKEEAETSLSEAQERLQTAEERKAELDEIVQKEGSEKTKKALESYNDAKDNLAEVKETRASSIQSNIDSIQNEISDLDTQINEMKQKETESKFSNSSIDMDVDLQENLTDAQKAELEQIKQIYKDNEDLYKDIAAQVLKDTGVSLPAEAICAIHFRESSCNFGTYLHNGEKLGQVTTLVPAGIYFDNFRDAAVDALERELDSSYDEVCSKYGVKNDCSTMSSVLMFTERYNGMGYRNHGCQSAYVYSGTTTYTGGMYVGDGNFSSSTYDPRCGTAVIIKELMEMS